MPGILNNNSVSINGVTISQKDFAVVFAALPGRCALLALDAPNYSVIATTNKFCELSFSRPEDLKGKTLWKAFPPNPEEPFFTADFQLRASFEKVIEQKAEHQMPVQRYDIKDRSNNYIESYWSVTNSPVLNTSGEVVYIIHSTDDITEKIRGNDNNVADVTAMALAKQALTESEQRLRSVVEGAPFPIGVYIGKEMRIVLANQSILDTWGKGNNVIGLMYAEVLPELENQTIYSELDSVYTTGVAFHAKNQRVDLVIKDRLQTFYFNYSFTPLYDTNGKVYGVMNTAADVTDLNIAKRQVEESEQNIRNIITQAPVAMCILKGSNYVVDIANTNMFELWGRQQSDVLGKPMFEAVPEVKDQGFEDLLEQVLKTGEKYAANERPVQLSRNGRLVLVYVNFVYQALREGDGSISGVLVVANEVTQQVLAKQELIRSEARHRLAVEAAQLGTYEIDITNNSIIHNGRTAEIFGFSTESIIEYETFKKAIYSDDIKIRSKAHEVARETGELFYEARIILPDSTLSWIRLNGRMFKNEKALPVLIGTIFDITQEKKAADILEQKINERTNELLQSNFQLEKINNELEQFTHISSHDLQEPLRKIQLFTNLIISQPGLTLEEGITRNLNKIKETAQRMSSTLTALLNYTQLKKADEFIEVNLNEILEGVLSDVELIISEKEAEVTSDTLPIINAIPHQIQQLFYNLINNALKFSKTDVAPVIKVKANVVDGNNFGLHNEYHNECVEIIIEDNGVGFEPNHGNKIFGMFQRLHNRHVYAGTGIGLALCKKVVENHNGVIWATSEVNNGAAFHVILPITQDK